MNRIRINMSKKVNPIPPAMNPIAEIFGSRGNENRPASHPNWPMCPTDGPIPPPAPVIAPPNRYSSLRVAQNEASEPTTTARIIANTSRLVFILARSAILKASS